MRRRTKRQTDRRAYTDYHVHQLACGHDNFGNAFNHELRIDSPIPLHHPDAPAELVEACRTAWPLLREAAIADRVEKWPCTRPIAFWLFDVERDETQTEFEQLQAMGVLSDDEIRRFALADADAEDYPDE